MSLLHPTQQTYEALGPFPLGTRELPFLASPLHTSDASDSDGDGDPFLASPFGTPWPSPYGLNGSASWLALQPTDDGWIDVVWPTDAAGWDGQRSSDGWAGLQHLALLRTEVNVPCSGAYSGLLVQGHAWAVVPQESDGSSGEIEWQTGDLYALSTGEAQSEREGVYGQVVQLETGRYWVYIKALYEIRMFGDPKDAPPTIHLKFTLAPAPSSESQADHSRQTVLSSDAPVGRPVRAYGVSAGLPGFGDVVGGWIWGEVAGIAVRAGAEDVVVQSVRLDPEVEGLNVHLAAPSSLVAHQFRPLTLNVTQTSALPAGLPFLNLIVATSHGEVSFSVPLAHASSNAPDTARYIFRDADGTASYAMAHPPRSSSDEQEAVVLALHGAGVEASSRAWTDAVPQRQRSWVVFPTGRTAWGYDWHGPSTLNIWCARDGLDALLRRLGKGGLSERSVVVGHSNGAQGANHLLLHHPDRLQGALSAAAYVKIQSYVPYSQWVSMRHADPALWGLLMTGLASYDEDVLAVNGVGVGRALVHGRDDDNVPVAHGRELAALHAQHSKDRSFMASSYQEVPGESHWFDSALSSPFAEDFIARHASASLPACFVETQVLELVVANPDEHGSKGGWRIVQLEKPGRLARLVIRYTDGRISVNTQNARRLSVDLASSSTDLAGRSLVIDGNQVALPPTLSDDAPPITFLRHSRHSPWKVATARDLVISLSRRYGPLSSILSSSGPLVLVVPAHAGQQHTRVARRIAHDAWLYGKIDARIVTDELLRGQMRNGQWDEALLANWVVIGGKENSVNSMLRETPVSFPAEGLISVRTQDHQAMFDPTNDPSTGVLSLHPHPANRQGLVLILAGTDAGGLERAFRLFPVRTGSPSNDWIIIGTDADWKGAGGVKAAGWWSTGWGWEESGSWVQS